MPLMPFYSGNPRKGNRNRATSRDVNRHWVSNERGTSRLLSRCSSGFVLAFTLNRRLPRAAEKLTLLPQQSQQLLTKLPLMKIVQLWRLSAKTACTPFLVPVLALEQADKEIEALIDPFARVVSFKVSLGAWYFALHRFGIGLEIDGALDFLEHHGEAEHDAEGREPGFLLLARRV